MERKSWQRLALASAAAVLFVGGGWVWMRNASAQQHYGPKVHKMQLNGGPVLTGRTQGGIGIEPGKPSVTPDGTQTLPLYVTDLYSKGFIEGIGEIDIRLDRERTEAQARPSHLTANQPDAEYPATQHMEFFPIFSINGEEFHAQEAAQVVNGAVDVFPPKPGTVYVLINKVTLVSEAGNTLEILPSEKFIVEG